LVAGNLPSFLARRGLRNSSTTNTHALQDLIISVQVLVYWETGVVACR
jgi:hypothetical protein